MANIIIESSNGYQTLSLEDKFLSNNREIFITDEINPIISNSIIKELMYLDRNDTGKEITIYINSPGGSVYDGLAIYDTIMALKSPVNTVCIGTCASMGAVLFLAGNNRSLYSHGRIMIHDASFGSADFSGLKPDEISERANDLLKTTSILRQIISDRTGQDMDSVTEKMKKDSYFTADEAIEFGLATTIL